MNGNAEILLIRKDGALILQHRDDKPGIANPGFVTSFGGHIEEGEDPRTAAWREIREETNLRPQKEDLQFFGTYRKTKERHGEDWDVHYFMLEGVDEGGLEVFEGQGFKVVRTLEEAKQEKLSTLMREVAEDYFKKGTHHSHA